MKIKEIVDKMKSSKNEKSISAKPVDEEVEISDEDLGEDSIDEEEEIEEKDEKEESNKKKITPEDVLLSHEKRIELLEFKTGLRTY